VLPKGTITFAQFGDPVLGPTVGPLTIVGAGEGATVIDVNRYSRALVVPSGVAVTLQDLTITNGLAQQRFVFPFIVGGDGGAIWNAGELLLLDVAITDTNAGRGEFTDNPSAPGFGGAGGPGGDGGAIFNTGTLSLNGATLAHDGAGDGGYGGDCCLPTPTSALPGGAGGSGGAIANVGGAVTIAQSTLSGDYAGLSGTGGAAPSGAPAGAPGSSGSGGALWSQGGSVTILNSTLVSNTAGIGGTTPELGITNQPGNGGAIAADAAASVGLLNDTLAGNTATGSGGGITAPAPDTAAYPVAGLTVQSSLLASNAGGNCAAPGLRDAGHNLSFEGLGCPSSFLTGDPRLGPLQDNGGPTATEGLASGSAAIAQIPGPGAGCPTTDQRGVPRAAPCSIGGYQPTAPALQPLPASHLLATSAQLNANVAPYAGGATVTVNWGTTPVLGRTINVKLGSSVTLAPFALTLTQLRPRTFYYYQLTITTTDGTLTGPTLRFQTRAVPTLGTLKLSLPKVSYRDSEPSTTAIVLQRCLSRKHGRCDRYRNRRTRTHRDMRGPNQIDLGHLSPGFYRLQLTPHYQGVAGRTVAATFTIHP
jgi:hypothetical protein